MTIGHNTRDHGGNLDAAIHRFGGAQADWLDLSTGINPNPYPIPAISTDAWAALPRKSDMARLIAAARSAYGTDASIIPMNGAQGAIQAVPWLCTSGHAAVLSPTYNEHAATLRAANWQVDEVTQFSDLSGADLAVVVNPNNPDGRRISRNDLLALAKTVGLLVVDESFADPEPELSIAQSLVAYPENTIVLRSFGKFYGLAGLRLGFALATGDLAGKLDAMAGPWPVSGPSITIATHALADTIWQSEATQTLIGGSARLDRLAASLGWRVLGGTPLFRTYETPDAEEAQNRLAQNLIWSRIFPYSPTWIRLGLPPSDRWNQLEQTFSAL